MQNVSINRSRVVFINLTEMDDYNGLEANLKGGGRFVEQNGYGHEIFNFRHDNGKCYGYTPPLRETQFAPHIESNQPRCAGRLH